MFAVFVASGQFPARKIVIQSDHPGSSERSLRDALVAARRFGLHLLLTFGTQPGCFINAIPQMGSRRRRVHTDRVSYLFSRDNVRGGLLAVLGALTLATGLYFLFLRPAMLPEDLRFVGVSAGQQPAQMIEWLGIVFRTWGAFLAGFGILLIGIGAYLSTQRTAFLEWSTAVAIGIGFGRFLMSNIILASDFVIFIGALFALALVVAFLLILPGRLTRNQKTPYP